MQIVITGAAGFIGNRLAATILAQGGLAIDGEHRSLDRLKLLDLVAPQGLPSDPRIEVLVGDGADPALLARGIDDRTDVVFHLAAVVSAAAEADFDLGLRVNLHGTMALLAACRRLAEPCRLVFASSLAVYGGDVVKGVVTDTTHLTPQTSYGVQKAASELLVMDYHRKGFIDGRSLRLPTIVVRPGKPNKAASTWMSSIIREPLTGQQVICPVAPQTASFVLSPRRVIDAMLHAVDLPAAQIGPERSIQLPGLTVTVDEMLDTLAAVGGTSMRAQVRFEPDASIQSIIDGWPRVFATDRALRLGFRADGTFRDIVDAHIEDELGGRIARASSTSAD